QCAGLARDGIPVVALHLIALLGDRHTAQTVPRGAITGAEAMAVGIDADTAMTGNIGPIGVADPGVGVQRSSLAFARQRDGLLCAQLPRMVKIELGNLASHQLRIRQSLARVFGGVARDGARSLHGGPDGRRRKIGRARAALAGAEVYGNAEAAV